MSILAGYMVPHPPIILPEVGGGREIQIKKTSDAYHTVAKEIAALKPELLIVTSPHATSYADYFHISPGKEAQGDFSEFHAEGVKIHVNYDTTFVKELSTRCGQDFFPAGTDGERDSSLDHGTMIPLYFINQYYTDYQIVRIGLSGLALSDHYKLGEYISETVEALNRRAVFIASGDLSHKLLAEGPYGFAKEGPIYDEQIMKDMGNGDFDHLITYDPSFLRSAAECGHSSFTIMAGAFDGLSVDANALSHEGPFGVGYGICTFYPKDHNKTRNFLDTFELALDEQIQKRKAKEDAYIALARESLETYVRTKRRMALPHSLPEEMYTTRAGAFVSLKIDGQLRGCIGTIGPMQENLAIEIIENAISAGTHDPRFSPVRAGELPLITISVDVLEEPEEISSESELDPSVYGVIVTKGLKRGLLLPNLDGIDSVSEQVAIAKQKAGIAVSDHDVSLQRFKVTRHKVAGETD